MLLLMCGHLCLVNLRNSVFFVESSCECKDIFLRRPLGRLFSELKFFVVELLKNSSFSNLPALFRRLIAFIIYMMASSSAIRNFSSYKLIVFAAPCGFRDIESVSPKFDRGTCSIWN